MIRPLACAAGFIALGSFGWYVGTLADDKKSADDEDPARHRATEQIALAERAISLGMEGFRASRIRLSDAQIERWSLRRIEALQAADASDDEVHQARVAHLDLMKSLEKLAESLFKSARAAELDVLEAKYARLEAERRLDDNGHDDRIKRRDQKDADRP